MTDKCTYCSGEGVVRAEEIITIKIPAGVAQGMQLSMQEKVMLPVVVVLMVICSL